MLTDFPPQVEALCEHGVLPYVGPPFAMAAPGFECECCHVFTFYIDSTASVIHADGTHESWGRTWTPKNRCGPCGGTYVKWRTNA